MTDYPDTLAAANLEIEVEETVRGMSFSYATTRHFFDFLITRGWTPPSPDVSDTPGPPQCHNGHPFEPGVDTDDNVDPSWCNVCGERRWRSALSATPEGGQPDTDDELLARAEKGTAGLSAKRIAALVADLASALRRKREDYDRVIGQSRTRGQSITRLERELAEASEATSEIYDKWVRADRGLAEARSHGEVLSRTTTEYQPPIAPDVHPTSLVHAYVKAEPGTEVLVVRATADQEETDAE